jgi:uncharacterized YceG family protein
VEERRRPEIRRHRSRSSGPARGLAALGGVVLGLGLLAAIAWAVVGRGGQETGEAATTAATTTGPPPKPVLKIVFPEVFTVAEMARRVGAVNEIAEDKRNITPKLKPREYGRLAKRLPPPTGFSRNRQKVPHLEGFLFPATYEFTEDTTTRELMRNQLDAFERAWGEVDLAYARSKNLTPYEVLIIASMVEEEVLVPKERPLVAAVIYNRLKVGFPLGIDATIRYGLNIPPTEPILQSQLDADFPYNTRKLAGLPPTPISNPGLASIQAAAHPAKVDFLFFVRKADCKSHFFTASQQEFDNYPRAGLQC